MSSKPFSWSFSRLNQYETCPYRYYKTRVSQEIIEPETESIIWGNRVHKALEDNIEGRANLPADCSQFQPVMDSIAKIPGNFTAEKKFAVDRRQQPVDFESSDAWCRCITDVFVENTPLAIAMDWKTGKVKYDFEQLKINALMIFAHYPEIVNVKVAYIWLKFKQVTKNEFTRAGPGALTWDKYITATSFMENSYSNNFWPKRKSGLCKNWCPVTSCEYNGHYKGGS